VPPQSVGTWRGFLHAVPPSTGSSVARRATFPGFAYSAANKNSGDIWDAQTLDTYVADPRKFMPGTKMVFAGLKNPEDRKALIECLKVQPDPARQSLGWCFEDGRIDIWFSTIPHSGVPVRSARSL